MKNILFGLNFSAHSIEFLKKKDRKIQPKTIKILSFMLPFSKENLSLLITSGLMPLSPNIDLSISKAL